jgi:uroporphyrinogen decarboxylase
MGGVDKLALIAGEKAIDRELARLAPLLEDGGFVPLVDHRCPPEVSYGIYGYYLKKKREWIRRNES